MLVKRLRLKKHPTALTPIVETAFKRLHGVLRLMVWREPMTYLHNVPYYPADTENPQPFKTPVYWPFPKRSW